MSWVPVPGCRRWPTPRPPDPASKARSSLLFIAWPDLKPEGANQRITKDIQVANCVQHLVADKFVFVTQAVAVEHAVFVEHNRVVKAAAAAPDPFRASFPPRA